MKRPARSGFLMGRPSHSGFTVLVLGLLASSASCALVLGYDDYTEAQSTSTTGTGSGSAGTGGVGGLGDTGGAGGTGGAVGVGGSGGDTGQGGAGAAGAGTGGSLPLQAEWSFRGGDEQLQAFNDVALTPSGDIVVAGDYEGTLDILGSSFTSSLGFELAVAQIGGDTHLPVWAKGTLQPDGGTSLNRLGVSVVADADGHVYVTGIAAVGAENQGFFTRMDAPGGAQASVTLFEGGGADPTARVVLDSGGRIRMVAGARDQHFTFGALESAGGPSGTSGDDIALLTCMPPDCSAAALTILGGASDETAYAMAADPMPGKAVFLTGTYRGTWADLPDTGSQEGIFVVKVSGAGVPLWSRGFVKTLSTPCPGSLEQARGRALTVNESGDVFVTGVMCGDTTFGADASGDSITLPGEGAADAFVASLDGTDGALRWARSFGDSHQQIGTGVAAGNNDAVFVCGTFAGTVDFGEGNVLDAGSMTESMFLAELAGGTGETRQMAAFGAGEPVEQRILHVAVNDTSVVLAGAWGTALSFGDGPALAPHGELDAFLVKFPR